MICPKCHNDGGSIIDSRPGSSLSDYSRRRRYKCSLCGERWSTIEVRVEDINLVNSYGNETLQKVLRQLEDIKELLISEEIKDGREEIQCTEEEC